MVVLGAAADEARPLLDAYDVTIVVAPDWEEGMGASLRTGLQHLQHGEATRCVVTLVDLPDVAAPVVRRLLDQPDTEDVLARATYDGTPGHPVLLGRAHWAGVVETADGDRGARDYLAAHAVDARRVRRPRHGEGRGSANPRPTRALSSLGRMELTSPSEVVAALGSTGYLADDDLATVVYLAQGMQRPLLLEGEPGTGKTALAEALAQIDDVPLIRLQCYEGIDASQALYDWDFPRQILHLRTLEAATKAGELDPNEAEKSLFDERFLLARPVLRALRESPAVLLVDEVDRADDEFEAFLLEVLSSWSVSIPELGTVTAGTPPTVVLTSNRTRELHDALKRRCLYHWIDHPGLEREVAIVRSRLPEVSQRLAEQVAGLVQRLREEQLLKPPGVAETLDWARALHRLGVEEVDLETAARTLGAVVKYREDTDRVKQALDRMLAGVAMSTMTTVREPDEILPRLRPRAAVRGPQRHPRPGDQLPRGHGDGRRRRRPGHLPGRPGDAVRRARRPGALRARLRGVVRGPRGRCRASCPARSRASSARRCRWGSPARRAARWSPTRSRPPPASGRCCSTATSRRCGPTRRRCWTR